MNLGVLWSDIYQDAVDIYGRDLDEATLIRRANRLIDDLKLYNLPTQERTDYIPYVYEFERYKLPLDYKSEGFISLHYDDQIDNNRNRTYTTDEPPFQHFNKSWKLYTQEDFNLRDKIDAAAIINNKGVEKLWLVNGRGDQTNQEINDCDSLTGWTAGGGAGNLTLDDDVKQEGDYSINFDLTAATAATLTLVLSTAIDLSDYEDRGVVRLFVSLPTAPSSIVVEVGESATKYYSQTITAQADGDSFDTENINELEFNFKDATATGAPTMSVSTHFKITLNFASACTDTDFRIDNIKAWKAEYLTFKYYSFYLVQTSAGVWKEYIDLSAGNDDKINILPEWRKPFVKGLLLEEMDKNADSRYERYASEFVAWFSEIQRRYPNRAKRVGSFWY